MHVEWHGQSAFTLTAPEATVVIDPFGDMGALAQRGRRFEYPPIEVDEADLVLVTHEHTDHNGVERELVANPVQFDESPPDIVRAPQFAEHTDEILRELGFDDEELIELKIAGAVT